jgi:hypothetical protein
MKRKASISHDETIIRRLRKDPDFAAEYLKAALEDENEPRVLLIALRHFAQAHGIRAATACHISWSSFGRRLGKIWERTQDLKTPAKSHRINEPYIS